MPIPLLLHSFHGGPSVLYQSSGPWMVPWVIESTEAEYQTLRSATVLIDYSSQAVIEVSGGDRVSFLQNLLTNDISKLSPGCGCRAALLDASAKLIAPLIVLADADRLWLVCELPDAATLMTTLERYHISEDVTLTNHERQWGFLALQGPRTIEFLTQVLGGVVSVPGIGDHATRTWEAIPLRIIRYSLTSEVGVLMMIPAEDVRAIWERVLHLGHSFGLRAAGWEALEIARIESGVPRPGIDMDQTNLLPETGLQTVAVSDSKGCYLGQEIIARLSTRGSVNKQLVGLRIEGAEIPQAGDDIRRGNESVGRVTSACRSLALHHPIALGYVKRGSEAPGTTVTIDHQGQTISAAVAALPLVKK